MSQDWNEIMRGLGPGEPDDQPLDDMDPEELQKLVDSSERVAETLGKLSESMVRVGQAMTELNRVIPGSVAAMILRDVWERLEQYERNIDRWESELIPEWKGDDDVETE